MKKQGFDKLKFIEALFFVSQAENYLGLTVR